MITALHIRVDGSMELFEYEPQDSGALKVLQERVGGWVESAPISDRQLTMYCNEEGKLLGLPRNDVASDMLAPSNPDWIAGDVVLVGAPDQEGYNTDLPQALKEAASR